MVAVLLRILKGDDINRTSSIWIELMQEYSIKPDYLSVEGERWSGLIDLYRSYGSLTEWLSSSHSASMCRYLPTVASTGTCLAGDQRAVDSGEV